MRTHSRPLYWILEGGKLGGYIGGLSSAKDKEESVDWLAIRMGIIAVVAIKKRARFITAQARRCAGIQLLPLKATPYILTGFNETVSLKLKLRFH